MEITRGCEACGAGLLRSEHTCRVDGRRPIQWRAVWRAVWQYLRTN
jgi:hypothetical protein